MLKPAALVLIGLLVAALLGESSPVAAQEDLPEVVKDLFAEAERLARSGAVDEAVQVFEEAIAAAPSRLEPYLALGALDHRTGRSEAALEIFERGLKVAPQDRDLLYNAAVLALSLGRVDRALEHAQAAVEFHPRDADLRVVQAAVLREFGRFGAAVTTLEAAAELVPSDARILFRLGNAYYQMGRMEEAIDAFQRAVRKDRGLLRAYYNLGAVLFEVGRDDEALEAYKIALAPVDKAFASGESVEPEHARAYRNLGAILLRRGEWNRALESYAKALALDPEQVEALYNQGYLLARLGRDGEAEDAYRRALMLDPSLPLAHLHLGRGALARGAARDAAASFLQALDGLGAESPERRDAWWGLAAARREVGDAEGREQALRALLDERPGDGEALLALGRDLRGAGRAAEAREILRRADRVAPNRSVTLELALAARDLGDDEAQARRLEQFLATASTDEDPAATATLRLSLARLRALGGRHDAARELLAPLLGAATPAEIRLAALRLDAFLWAADGEFEQARRRLAEVLAASPDDVDAVRTAAILAARDGEVETALRMLGEMPGSEGLRGRLAWSAGRLELARPLLEKAASDGESDPVIELALGEMALGRGEADTAAVHLAEAARCPAGGEAAEGLRIVLGDPAKLCERARLGYGMALTAQALDALSRRAASQAREQAEQALAQPLAAPTAALARYLRGSAALLLGDSAAARRDLTAALEAAEPDAAWRAAARNNLGVARVREALARQADPATVRADFEAAIQGGRAPEALLNLAILLDDHLPDKGLEALELYERYLAIGGRRSEEVRGWSERLQRLLK